MSDKEILDWLNEQIVSEIYLDDGRLIDVRGLDVRKAIQASTPPATPAPSHVECLRCRFTGTRPTDGNERNPCPVCGAGVYCHQEEAASVPQATRVCTCRKGFPEVCDICQGITGNEKDSSEIQPGDCKVEVAQSYLDESGCTRVRLRKVAPPETEK